MKTNYQNWILTILLLVTFLQIPIYIYVLELHSNALADIRERLVRIETKLETRKSHMVR